MLTRRFHGPSAVVEGERHGLNLLLKHPHLIYWIPVCYEVANHEFQNPSHSIFEYNFELNRITKHTQFSKYISDLIYYTNIENMPYRISSNVIAFIATVLIYLLAYF